MVKSEVQPNAKPKNHTITVLPPLEESSTLMLGPVLPAISSQSSGSHLFSQPLPSILNQQVMKKPTSSYENLFSGTIISCLLENISEKMMLIDLFGVLGAVYFEHYCEDVSIVISDGSSEDFLKFAKNEGAKIVSPIWVHECISTRKKLDPEVYSIL